MLFDSTDVDKTLFMSLLSAGKVHGRDDSIAEDIERKPLKHGAIHLARELASLRSVR